MRHKVRVIGMLFVAMLGVLTLAACDVGGAGGPAGKSNADLLKEAAANMKAAKSYRLDADVTQGENVVKMGGEIEVTDKNAKLDMEVSGQKISMIQVGDKVYISSDGGATYMDAGGAMSSTGIEGFTQIWDSFKPEDVDKAKDALKDGTPATEKIDGVDTKHMTANSKDLASLNATGGGTTDGTVDIWVSTDAKPYVRQMKIDGTSDGQPLKGTLKWSRFDEDFNIEAPPTSFKLNLQVSAAR